MAPSLASLDIINPQYNQSFLLEENPETFDLSYDTLPPTMFSFEANGCQSFTSSMLSLDQIDQILAPNCYNSSQMQEDQEFDTQINMFDTTYFNNLVTGRIGDSMFGEDAQVFSNTIKNNASCVPESYEQNRVSQKRHIEGDDVQISKKQCGTNRKTRVASPTKDPQSLAAKNRREKISGRLRVLQELVPNGTKVDLVTMLEKAISYVKFLQLQVKVLETDDFWPAQGGNAPDITQVEEAIDAILASRQNNAKC